MTCGKIQRAFSCVFTGDSLGVVFVKPIKVREEQRSMPSSAWLMPSDKAWGPDEILVMQPERNYTVNDYKQFFQDINYMDGWYMRQDTVNLIRDLTPPGIKVHCLHGINVKTPGLSRIWNVTILKCYR